MHLSGTTLYAFSMLVHHTVRYYCIGIIEVWAFLAKNITKTSFTMPLWQY